MIALIVDSIGFVMLLLLSMHCNGDGSWSERFPLYGKLRHQHYYQGSYSLVYWYGVLSFFRIQQNTWLGLEVFMSFLLLEIVLFIWLVSPIEGRNKELLWHISAKLKRNASFFELKETQDFEELQVLLHYLVFPLLFFTANAYLLVGLLFTFNLL